MNKMYWPFVALVFVAALGCSVVFISILGVQSPDPNAPHPEPAHTDLSTTFGSENAKVVAIAFIPVGQECVHATVQALRQLSGMYPEQLFVGLADMEAVSPAAGLTFRGHELSDTPAILKEIGESPPPDLDNVPSAETMDEPPADDTDPDAALKGVFAELERNPPKTSEQMLAEERNAEPEGFCALISINGRSRFELPTGHPGEAREVYLSGPHGTLYTAEDIRAAVETTIERQYGTLPAPRMPWAGVQDVMAGREPVPLRPR